MKPFLTFSVLILVVAGSQWVRLVNQCDYDIDLHFKSEEDDLHRKLPGRGIYCEEAIAGRYWYSAAGDFNMSAVVEVQSFLANITSYWLMAQVFHEPKVAIRPFWTITGRQCGVEMTCDRLGCPDAVTNLPDHFNAEHFSKGKAVEIRYCYDQPMEDLPCPHQPPPSLVRSSEFDDE